MEHEVIVRFFLLLILYSLYKFGSFCFRFMVNVFVHTTPRDVTVSSVRTSTMISLGDQQGRMPLMLVKVGIKTPMKNKSLVFQAQIF